MASALQELAKLPELLSLPETSRRLSQPYQTTYSLITSGRLPAVLLAGRWLIDSEDVRSFKRERAQQGRA